MKNDSGRSKILSFLGMRNPMHSKPSVSSQSLPGKKYQRPFASPVWPASCDVAKVQSDFEAERDRLMADGAGLDCATLAAAMHVADKYELNHDEPKLYDFSILLESEREANQTLCPECSKPIGQGAGDWCLT